MFLIFLLFGSLGFLVGVVLFFPMIILIIEGLDFDSLFMYTSDLEYKWIVPTDLFNDMYDGVLFANREEVMAVPDERVVYTEGFADPAQRAVRDGVIANGYNPNESNQPFAKNLSSKLAELRKKEGHSQMPDNLTPQDRRYMDVMIRQLYPNYNPNIHYMNSSTFRTYLKNLF